MAGIEPVQPVTAVPVPEPEIIATEEPRLSLLEPSALEQIPVAFREEVQLLGQRLRGLNEENTELRERLSEMEKHIDSLSKQVLLLAESNLALTGVEIPEAESQPGMMAPPTEPSAAESPVTRPATPTPPPPAPMAVTPSSMLPAGLAGDSRWLRYLLIGGAVILSLGVALLWFRRLRQRERYREIMYRL